MLVELFIKNFQKLIMLLKVAISSKEKLLDFITPRPSDMFSCQGGPWIAKLRVYSYLFLLDREKATAALEEYQREFHRVFYDAFDRFKAEIEAEWLEISKLIQKSDEEITSHFQTVCEETRSKFFQTKRR